MDTICEQQKRGIFFSVKTYSDFQVLLFQFINECRLLPESRFLTVVNCFGN